MRTPMRHELECVQAQATVEEGAFGIAKFGILVAAVALALALLCAGEAYADDDPAEALEDPAITLMNASAKQTSVVSVKGTLRYDYAYEMLEIVNKDRKALGLTELGMDEDLLEAAMLRAAECSIYPSHTRPDGTPFQTTSMKALEENYVPAYEKPQSAYNGFMSYTASKNNILNDEFASIGVGCFITEGGALHWVQLFGNKTADVSDKPSNADKTLKISTGNVTRLWGPTALDTMNAITEVGFEDDSCSTVVLATLDGYWDALSASALAGLSGCPVLLTSTTALSAQTKEDIQRLGATKVYIAGGTAAVSKDVATQVADLGVTVKRLAGDDAIATALKIYEEGKSSWASKKAIVATTGSYHDALAMSPYAYAMGAPIFLVNGTEVRDDTLSAIKDGGFDTVIICGGTAAVSKDVEKKIADAGSYDIVRISGDTAYETAADIAEWSAQNGLTATKVGVATGTDYYDALTGASLCGKLGSPLVLLGHGNTAACDDYIAPARGDIDSVYVFGGTAAVSDNELITVLNAYRG